MLERGDLKTNTCCTQTNSLERDGNYFQKEGLEIFCCLNNYERVSHTHHKVQTLGAYEGAGYENKF